MPQTATFSVFLQVNFITKRHYVLLPAEKQCGGCTCSVWTKSPLYLMRGPWLHRSIKWFYVRHIKKLVSFFYNQYCSGGLHENTQMTFHKGTVNLIQKSIPLLPLLADKQWSLSFRWLWIDLRETPQTVDYVGIKSFASLGTWYRVVDSFINKNRCDWTDGDYWIKEMIFCKRAWLAMDLPLSWNDYGYQ